MFFQLSDLNFFIQISNMYIPSHFWLKIGTVMILATSYSCARGFGARHFQNLDLPAVCVFV